MRVLIIGSGGREHAISYFIKKSIYLEELYCIPGNAGISRLAKIQEIDISIHNDILDFIKKYGIDLVVVGPEAPLVEGLVDYLSFHNIKVFGPRKDVALLEGSKIYAKKFMRKYNIPTPKFYEFYHPKETMLFLKKDMVKFPLVIKADGLAGGKGSVICQDYISACACVEDMMIKKIFGSSGEKILIEDYQQGKEISILIFCDGGNYKIMPPACDYKKAFDGDRGVNTGGMGAYASWQILNKKIFNTIKEEIIERTLLGIKEEGKSYKGVLYFGLILTNEGPKVLEYNVRLGDPEAQVILPLLKSDLLEIICSTVEGKLSDYSLEWREEDAWSVCVVLVSGGYPGSYKKGYTIYGLEEFKEEAERKDILIFHAGTKLDQQGRVITDGGRVLNVVGTGDNLRRVIEEVFSVCSRIKFENIYYRKDIAKDLLL